MRPEWKDVSSWSQSTTSKERETPKAWEVRCGQLRVCLHHVIHCGDAWFVTCNELQISRCELASADVDEAKHEAIIFVRMKADLLLLDADKLFRALGDWVSP